MDQPAPELVGVGSPLVDLLLRVEDAFLTTHVSGGKGGMEMVDPGTIDGLVAQAGGEVERAPGGAAANTTVGCANLGIEAAFIGCVGDDDYGTFFQEAMQRQGCRPRLVTSTTAATGRVLSLITPDTERTMRTFLGAAAQLDPASFDATTFAGSRLVMLEGYTLFNHDLTRAVARAAKAAGCELALDLASFEVVRANRPVLEELLDGLVDLVFANEEEARAWCEEGEEAAWHDLAARCAVAVVKIGKDGAWIARGDERERVPAEPVEAVDTTGAGDNWAAGFLAGHLRGLPLIACGRLGAKCGAAAVQVTGAQIPPPAWQAIRGYLAAWA